MAAAIVALGCVVAEPGPTAAEAAGCESSQIAVVVSFNSLGGGTQTSCIGDVGSGLSALGAAGHSYTFVDRQPGLVCTIDNAPNPCNGAPTNAYWSYWTASLGGNWSYSNVGAGNRNPAPGSAEGWSFGSGGQPGIAPPGVNAPPPPPPPPPPAPPAPAPAPGPAPPPAGGPGGGSSPPAEVPGPGSESGDPQAGDDGAAGPGSSESGDSTSDSTSAGTRGDDGASSAEARADAELETASDSTSTGTPWALLGTVAGLALLGGASYWQHRRRTSVPPGA